MASPKIRIIRLGMDDKKQIIELDKAAFVDYDLPAITSEEVGKLMRDGFAFGIKENGKLIANIQMVSRKKENDWYLWGIATLPEKQGLGLADRLLKEVLKLAESKGIEKITATIRPGNTKSIRLFIKNGFVKKEYVKDYHGKGIDRIAFEWLNQKFKITIQE